MNYYKDVYRRRITAYGDNRVDRVQSKREREFELMLEKSIFRVSYHTNTGVSGVAVHKPYRQDRTSTYTYLLTPLDVDLPAGTFVYIDEQANKKETTVRMILYLQDRGAGGYNKYTLVELDHEVIWKNRKTGEVKTELCHFFTQANAEIVQKQKTVQPNPLYFENEHNYFLVVPSNTHLYINDYIIVRILLNKVEESFTVVGKNIHSTPGVEYITVDPVYTRDVSPKPEKKETDDEDDFFWLDGE